MRKVIRNFVVVALVFRSSQLFSSDIACSISVDKKLFLKCENVWLTVTVTNTTSKSLHINAPLPSSSCLKLVIKNLQGKEFRRFERSPFSSWNHREKLLPGKSVQETFPLLPTFGTASEGESRPFYFLYVATSYFPPENYAVTAEYESGVGKVVSNTVNFEVVEPTGSEKDALASFVAAVQRQYENDAEGSATLLKTFAERYPQSAYAPMALYEVARALQFRDKKKAIDAANYLMEKYPNTYSGRDGQIFALGRLPAQQHYELLQSSLRKFPNTIVGKNAEKTLKALSKQQ
jgi:hypothetical protein